MRSLLLAVAACLLVGPITPVLAQDSKSDVLAAVGDFMQALKTRDLDLITSRIDSTTRFTLIRPGPNGPRVLVLAGADFVKAVTRPDQPALDEPIRNPIVQIDGDVATVWAEYQVRRDGKVTHCGHDGFHLARLGGQWRVINIIDSFQPTGCGEMWP